MEPASLGFRGEKKLQETLQKSCNGRDGWISVCVWEVLPKLLEWTYRSLVCHGKHNLLELSWAAFPPSPRGGKRSATAAFLCVLPLRPSEYLGDNGHVVNEEAAVEAAQTWAKGEHWNGLIKSQLLCWEQWSQDSSQTSPAPRHENLSWRWAIEWGKDCVCTMGGLLCLWEQGKYLWVLFPFCV